MGAIESGRRDAIDEKRHCELLIEMSKINKRLDLLPTKAELYFVGVAVLLGYAAVAWEHLK